MPTSLGVGLGIDKGGAPIEPGAPPPVETYALLAESGDRLITESSDVLTQEQGS